MKFISLILIILFPAAGFCEYTFFKPAQPVVQNLTSGPTLFLLEDHEFPTVQMILYFKGGSALDPRGKEGLASLALQGLRLGGTQSKKPAEVEEALEFVGGSLEVGVSEEFATITLNILKKDLEPGLEILFDLLKNPLFDPDQLELIKKRSEEALLRESEDPVALGYREFPKLVYGKESVWGRKLTLKSLKRIKRKDLLEFYRQRIGPDRIVLAASGDFTVLDLVRSLKIHLAGWNPIGGQLPVLPPVPIEFEAANFFLLRKGLTQSTVMMGHLGTKRDNPDKYPLLVMNYILGGSGALSSRLGERIRTVEGKAYSVWSSFGFGPEAGLFVATAQTASPQTVGVLEAMQELITQMAKNPQVTEAELERAKQTILRSLFFDYETRFSLVKDLAKFHLWGYPDDYLDQFQQKIAALTREEVERVAQQYLHPEDLKILVVGAEQKSLKKSGYWRRVKP